MSDDEGAVFEEPESWTSRGLLDVFMENWVKRPDRRYAFLLGAGASVSSGILPAARMAREWVKILFRRHNHDRLPESGMEAWARTFLGIADFAMDDAAVHYSKIYDRLYSEDSEDGYAYLEDAMKRAEPSIGYSILAQVLADPGHQHRVVVTTNFDNLVADALAIYTDTFPMVCGHEFLAGFAKARLRRPLVVKIHRDLLYGPKSGVLDTACLDERWKPVLGHIFAENAVIVIGYGGNDGSLMGFLEESEKGTFRHGLYWCYRRDDGRPRKEIREVVARNGGKLVPILGFDEFMLELSQHLKYAPQDRSIEDKARDRAKRYRKRHEHYLASVNANRVGASGSGEEDPERDRDRRAFGEALVSISSRARDWWSWELKALTEPDPEKKKRIYEEGLKACPESADLYGNFANFMRFLLKDNDEAERLYRRALELDPRHANNAGNFANFMADIRKDNDEAERLYRSALELDPDRADNTGNFAVFMADIRKDYDEAERLFRRALELEPQNAVNIANFANFTADARKDNDEAEHLYRRALEFGPDHAGIVANFAAFLVARKRVDEARKYIALGLALETEITQATAELCLYWCAVTRLAKQEDSIGLSRLKSVLTTGFERGFWRFDDVLSVLAETLEQEEVAFYRALADAIPDADKVPELERFERWRALEPIPVDGPWDVTPESGSSSGS